VSIGQALRDGAQVLSAAGIADAPRDARRLMAHALGVDPGRITLLAHDPMPDPAQAAFQAMIARRGAREPVSKITGKRAFYGRDFIVTSDVLDPRPETETLVAWALSAPFRDVLDLGTGSGCILITLLAERPDAHGAGLDLSPAALKVAEQNAQAQGVAGRARFQQSDWCAEMPESQSFDLIVSNPPYIALQEMPDLSPEVLGHDPRIALTDEGDGLQAYRAIADQAPGHLRAGGRMAVEIGPTQGVAVSRLFQEAGLENVAIHPDLDSRDRVVTGQKPA
jgi:release factor glutamine methyltransferase